MISGEKFLGEEDMQESWNTGYVAGETLNSEVT